MACLFVMTRGVEVVVCTCGSCVHVKMQVLYHI